jgi:hypothetical protein
VVLLPTLDVPGGPVEQVTGEIGDGTSGRHLLSIYLRPTARTPARRPDWIRIKDVVRDMRHELEERSLGQAAVDELADKAAIAALLPF